MGFICKRGGADLNLEELKAHLAALLQLENVATLLGAGASVGAGGLVVRALWNTFVEEYAYSAKNLLDWNFVKAEHVDPDRNSRVLPNIERLGDSLEIALVEWKRLNNSQAAPALEMAINDVKRCVVKASALDQKWWQQPSSTRDAPALGTHKTLLQKLTSARQPGQTAPWIFTTNYDLAVEWAAEAIDLQVLNGFLGLHHRRFSPQSFDLGLRNTMARGEARFGVYNIYLAKLHGSLTWAEEDGEVYERPATACYDSINNFIGGSLPSLPQTMVFPRAAKYMETIGNL